MQKEICINRMFKVSSFIFTVVVLIINALVYANALTNAFLVRWLIEIIEILVFIFIFVKLVYLTKLENRIMYLRQRKSLVLYFLGTILFLWISFFSNFLPWLLTHSHKNVAVPWRLNIKGVYWVCSLT